MGRERDKVEKVCRNRSEVGVNVGGYEMRCKCHGSYCVIRIKVCNPQYTKRLAVNTYT